MTDHDIYLMARDIVEADFARQGKKVGRHSIMAGARDLAFGPMCPVCQTNRTGSAVCDRCRPAVIAHIRDYLRSVSIVGSHDGTQAGRGIAVGAKALLQEMIK